MAGLAVDPFLPVNACMPFIRGSFMTGAAQFCIRSDRHRFGGMGRLERSVAGFAGHAFFGELAGIGDMTGCVAFQTAGLVTQLMPVALEDR